MKNLLKWLRGLHFVQFCVDLYWVFFSFPLPDPENLPHEVPKPRTFWIDLNTRKVTDDLFDPLNRLGETARVPNELSTQAAIAAFVGGLSKHDMRSPLARFVIEQKRLLKGH